MEARESMETGNRKKMEKKKKKEKESDKKPNNKAPSAIAEEAKRKIN